MARRITANCHCTHANCLYVRVPQCVCVCVSAERATTKTTPKWRLRRPQYILTRLEKFQHIEQHTAAGPRHRNGMSPPKWVWALFVGLGHWLKSVSETRQNEITVPRFTLTARNRNLLNADWTCKFLLLLLLLLLLFLLKSKSIALLLRLLLAELVQ